jgi:hypothetical protein
MQIPSPMGALIKCNFPLQIPYRTFLTDMDIEKLEILVD